MRAHLQHVRQNRQVATVAAEEAKPRHLELPDYIRILSKQRWFILIVTAVAALVGGLYALSSEKKFEATSLVLVQQRPQGFFWVTGDEAAIAPTVAMETYARIARGSDVADLAARRLRELPAEARIIADAGEIQSTLNVTVIKPDLLRIDSTSTDERKARYFANYVAQAFVEVNKQERQKESGLASEFLEHAVEEQRGELASILDEMSRLGRESGFVDMDQEVTRIVGSLYNYEDGLRAAEADLEAAQARLAELERTRATQSPTLVSTQPVPNPEYQAMLDRLTQAQVELETLSSQYTDGHPRVLNARALVQQLRSQLAAVPEIIEAEVVQPNPAVAGIEAELKAARVDVDQAQARYNATAAALSRLREQMQGLPEQRQQWQALADRAEATRAAYLSLQEQLRQARLAQAIKEGNARVVDVANSARSIEASFPKSLVFAGALGLFVGLALAILLEALDDTIYSVEDLQRVTDLYLLGIVPLRTDEAGSLVALTAPKSPPAEAYRTLRSNIRFSLFDKPATTFMVTSAGTGEGKSVTAANLAIVYAQSGDSVILVDTDLRRPVVHRLFGIDADLGLTNVLVGDTRLEDAIVQTEVPGLRVLASGPLPPNPAELLESERMMDLVRELSEQADMVIFDSPPAVMLTDAGILSSKVDRTIIVAESGQVTERAMRDLERLFRHARADVLGVVLNKLRVTGGDYYYYYYYYYYDYAARSSQAEAEHGRLSDEAANGVTAARPAAAGSALPEEARPEPPPQDLRDLSAPAPEPEDDPLAPRRLADLADLSAPETEDGDQAGDDAGPSELDDLNFSGDDDRPDAPPGA